MHSYAKFNAVDLPYSVGFNSKEGLRRADGRAGHLCHGPYIALNPGKYAAAFFARRDEKSDFGEVEIDICADHGSRCFTQKRFPVAEIFTSIAGMLKVDFDVDVATRACEVRLSVPQDFILEVRDLIIFRRTSAAW